MDPLQRFCPHLDCPARGHVGQGNVTIHSRVEQRYLCSVCGHTFSEREGTVLSRLHADPTLVLLVLTLVAHGCPIAAITAAFGFQARTVRAWVEKAGRHCETLHAHLVERPRDLGQIQADELRVKRQKGIVWVAMALAVPSRLWLGAIDSLHRDTALAQALLAQVRRCALERPLLVVTDGWSAYKAVIRHAFRTSERTGQRGRPRLVPWADRMIGRVVKRKEKRRVVEVVCQLLEGTATGLVERLQTTQGGGHLNTAYIERLNATFRSRLGCLVRKTRSLARRQTLIHTGVYLVGAVYNFCAIHDSLSQESLRTPAMAAGITDHPWSVKELLCFRVPPPRWQPPKRRGRKSKALQQLIARWAT
jgi:transposase-like protein/IS1 family transposase